MRLFLALLFLSISGTSLFAQYQGKNANPAFLFPIDGGRKLIVPVSPQKGKEIAIGYLTVTSVDSNGALNSQADQAAVNQLYSQVTQLYAQIFNQTISQPPTQRQGNMAPQNQNQNSSCPQNCSPRRTPRWR